ALPVQLALEFGRTTEALVIQRSDADPKSCPRFVAIIDARADRRRRAWFAERHEPSHLLIGDPGANAIWRRTRRHRPEPIEQVVDSVASALGFWQPVVQPVLSICLSNCPYTLEALEETRQQVAPDASKEASFRAFIEMIKRPLVLLWVADGCRREDEAPGGDPQRSMALRARKVLINSTAKCDAISIWPNFQIPPHSAIHLARADSGRRVFVQTDDLDTWASERHGSLASCQVRVIARGSWATIEPF